MKLDDIATSAGGWYWQAQDSRSSQGLLLRLMKLLLTSTLAVGHLFILRLEDPVEFKDCTKENQKGEEEEESQETATVLLWMPNEYCHCAVIIFHTKIALSG